MLDFWNWLLGVGVEPKALGALQVSARAAVVFLAAVVMVRFGDRRFLSRKTPFDAVVGFVLASTLARAVNGAAPLLPTLAGSFVILILHRILARAAARYHRVGTLLKGHSDLIIRNGELSRQAARANDFSENDVLEDLRLNGHVADVSEVALAYLERDGNISVVPSRKS